MTAALTLVVGDEELLVARAVATVVRARREANPEAELRELTGGELVPGDLSEALSPSLFGDDRVVVVESGQDLSKEALADLVAHVPGMPDEIKLVVVHAGGAKGKGVVTELLKAGAERVDCAKVTKASERKDFLRHEFRRAGRQVDESALSLLLDAVGNDLRELSGAASQLVADCEGTVTDEAVKRYYQGRADASTFTIAERAVAGDFGGALELLRWVQSTGGSMPGVTGALATTLRSIGRVSGERGPAGALAGRLGMAPWQVERAQRQSRDWSSQGLVVAMQAVAVADGEVKGEAVDAGYAVEKALLSIVRARRLGQR